MNGKSRTERQRAFTLMELMVVVTVFAVLAALLLPSFGGAKSVSQSTACLNNLSQLQKAWLMYAHDNDDWLPPDRNGMDGFDRVGLEGSWVMGNAQNDTNTVNIQQGLLFRSVPNSAVYHCPSDRSMVRDFPRLPQSRSYSLDLWLNAEMHTGTSENEINVATGNLHKLSQVAAWRPERIFVFIDEHPESIDDGAFSIIRGDPLSWSAIPSERHSQGCNLSYADGHVENHHWKWHRRVQSLGYAIVANSNDVADLAWLVDRLPKAP